MKGRSHGKGAADLCADVKGAYAVLPTAVGVRHRAHHCDLGLGVLLSQGKSGNTIIGPCWGLLYYWLLPVASDLEAPPSATTVCRSSSVCRI